eukprot:SAG22_NODE_4928_length_1129_cov_1.600971_2_plen_228_part_01
MKALLKKKGPKVGEGFMELEKGAKFGGKFGKWVKLFFIIEGTNIVVYKSDLDSKPPKGEPEMTIAISDCAIRFPKSERKGRPHVFRIDTTNLEKLMVDPGTPEGKEMWIIALGNAGANVQGEWAEKLDAEKASALVTRGSKKGWMNMKVPIIGMWKPFWFELDGTALTQHERPGSEAKSTTDISLLQLRVGAKVTAELEKDFSFFTTPRGSEPMDLPWAALAVDSKVE